MVQLKVQQHPVAKSTARSFALASLDVFWKTDLPRPTIASLRLTLRRTHDGLTQDVLALGPDATQAVAVTTNAGETVYGTVDKLRLPAGLAVLYGNISLSRWLPDARYTLAAALLAGPDWHQQGQTVEWPIPDLSNLRPGETRSVQPWTPFTTLQIVML